VLVIDLKTSYLNTMPKRSKKSAPAKEQRWAIWRIRGTPAAFLGHVHASDEKTALEKAAEEFHVRPELRNKLMAQRTD
jgi:hypothetical protein